MSAVCGGLGTYDVTEFKDGRSFDLLGSGCVFATIDRGATNGATGEDRSRQTVSDPGTYQYKGILMTA